MPMNDLFAALNRQIISLVRNDYALFFFMFIAITIILQLIYGLLIKNIGIFNNGEKTNNPGKIISWTLALITTTSFAYVGKRFSIEAFYDKIVDPYGIISVLIISFFLFLGFKKIPLSISASSFFSGLIIMVLSANILPMKTEAIFGVFVGGVLCISGILFYWVDRKS